MHCSYCHDLLVQRAIQLKADTIIYHSCSGDHELWLDHSAAAILGIEEYKGEQGTISDFACPRCKNIMLETRDFLSSGIKEAYQCRRCSGIKVVHPLDGEDLDKSDLKITHFLRSLRMLHRHERESGKADRFPSFDKVEQVDKTEYRCPHCSKALTQYRIQQEERASATLLEICDTCHGIWLDKDDISDLPRPTSAKKLDVDYDSIIPSKRNCPKCREIKLVSMKFTELETIIDCCPSCFGTWLDGGEFQDFNQHLQNRNQNVIDTLVNNTVFQQPALCQILKKYSRTLHNLDSQVQEQDKNLEQAREIQRRLLFKSQDPQSFLFHNFGVCSIATFWHPARIVGGDYFDFIAFTTKNRKLLGICQADVSGKGLPASLLMTNLQALLNAFVPSIPSPSELCSRLNTIFYQNSEGNRFITIFYGMLNLETGEFTYTNGGHNPPLLQTGSSQHWLKEGGTVLGLLPDWEYIETTVTLSPGDRLLIYTDGVSESENPETEEEFGEKRLATLLADYDSLSVKQAHRKIVQNLKEFNKGVYVDDTTLTLVQFEESQ